MDFQLFKQLIQEQIANRLPGETAHSNLMPMNRSSTSIFIQNKAKHRKSAVGLILYPEVETIKCVLIERPSYDGFHSGQISFPGGKINPKDPHLEYTARRECYEEINLPIGNGELIGKLSEVYIPVSQFLVQPFVFILSQKPLLSPDEREVKSIIEFDIFHLLKDSVLKTKDMMLTKGYSEKNVPYFDLDGHTVWGATAMILSEFREILRVVC